MYNLSNDAKTALKSNAVTTTVRITLTSDNTVIDGNNLTEVIITDQCYQDGVIIGTAMCKEVEIELIDNNYDLADKEFSLEVGVLLPNNTYEYIPYGNFIIKDYQKIVSSNHYKIIAYDYMDKFNPTFIDDNPTVEDSSTYVTPMTLQQFYQYVANQYNVTIETQNNLPNADFVISEKPYFDGMSGRVVLSRIAEMMGCFAKINRNNKLEMRLKNTTSEQFSRSEMNNSLEIDDRFGPINVIVLRLSQVEGENITKRDEESIAEYGETTLQIQDNPFVYTEALRLLAIDDIYDQVDGFSYYPTTFNGKLIYLDTGDEVEVQDMATNSYYKTIILKQVLKIPATRASSFENKALTKTGLEYQFTPEQVRKDKRVEYLVDKQNGQIIALVSETEHLGNEIDNILDTTGTASGKQIYLDDASNEPLVFARLNGETSQATKILPDEYTQIDYIKRYSINSPYIDTGFKPNNNTKISIDASLYSTGSGGRFLFGTRNSARTDVFCGLIWTNDKVSGGYGSGSLYQSDVVQAVNVRFNLTLDKNLLYHNGTLLATFAVQTFTSENNLYIGTINTNGTFDNTQGFKGNIYSCKIWDNGTLIRNYIPCKRNSDNKIGLYDLINKAFYTTGNQYDFGAGEVSVLPSPDYPSPIINVETRNMLENKLQSRSVGGVDFTVDKDGVVTANGTATGNFSLYLNTSDGSLGPYLNIKAGTYYFSGCTGGSSSTYFLQAALQTANPSNGQRYFANYTDDTRIIIEQDNGIALLIAIKNGAVLNNVKFYPMLSADDSRFVPYNNIQARKNNKNLVVSNITYSNNLVDTRDWVSLFIFAGFPGNTASLQEQSILGGRRVGIGITKYTFVANKDYTMIRIKHSGASRDLNNDFHCYLHAGETYTISINITGINPSIVGGFTYDNVQVEKGDTATEFVEHQEQVFNFPLTEGQHLMQGTYLADDGVHNTRKQVIYVGDDDEGWNKANSSYIANAVQFYKNKPDDMDTNATISDINVSHFKNAEVVNGIRLATYINFFPSTDLNITTTTEWKTWLSNNPVTVEYPLATEEVVPYTEEQQTAWNAIRTMNTYKRVTNISSDASADIEYVKDNGLDIYETRANAERQYEKTTESFAKQEITNKSITNTVSSIETNTYTKTQTDENIESAKSEMTKTIEGYNSTWEQTATGFEGRINHIEENGVDKVQTTMGYTFDNEGLKINRTNAETGTIIDEAAIKVIDKTGYNEQDLLYAGYVKEGNTNYPQYVGQTIVFSKNMIVQNYLVVPNSRFEAYVNPVLGGKATGVFGV